MKAIKIFCRTSALVSGVLLLLALVKAAQAGSDFHPWLKDKSRSTAAVLLPARAEPRGYSLEDMAALTAAFNVTIDALGTHPGTPPKLVDGKPFQELYTTTTNTFEVRAGTVLYVPVYQNTSSPPLVGNYPVDITNRRALLHYTFSRKQLGLEYARLSIDGIRFPLNAHYVVGARVPPLPDGGGTQYMNVAAFLILNKKGPHTVETSARPRGDAIIEATQGSVLDFTLQYKVNVH